MKSHLFTLFILLLCTLHSCKERPSLIDRTALLVRNSPVVTRFDSLQSLSVGNGGFAFTVDATGLQTFAQQYSNGIPLGTMSDWGWHSFPNPDNLTFEQTLVTNDFGRGHQEVYTSQTKENKAAADWYRMNPHRLHLGTVGFALSDTTTFASFSNIYQRLDLENGIITSTFRLNDEPVSVQTCVHPEADQIAVHIEASMPQPLLLRMPYPSGQHSDDGCRWTSDTTLHHVSYQRLQPNQSAPLIHHLCVIHHLAESEHSYQLLFSWDVSRYGQIAVEQHGCDSLIVIPQGKDFAFTCQWAPCHETPYNRYTQRADAQPISAGDFEANALAAKTYWNTYWQTGGMVDFSDCQAPEAAELERRVVLSQYLLAVNCAGKTPPQETGLTYNSWFGKFHLEMIWWHQAQYALWGHPELLERSLAWYQEALPQARQIAERQGFKGIRWMKMTDPTAAEAPSNVGSYLMWQQPHIIYLAELVRRAYAARGQQLPAQQENDYYDLIRQTANFMCDVVTYDSAHQIYSLRGLIPAQETLRASTTVNPPFELSQWHFALDIACQWAQRIEGNERQDWITVRDHLAPLHSIIDETYSAEYGPLYTASEDATDTYHNEKLTSDHMAVLGAGGLFPYTCQFEKETMRNTLHWVIDHWNWEKTWGWDHPMTAMCAARLGESQIAVDALLSPRRTNTYLVSGHNYQDTRLRLYLPGNGGLLTAVAMMCAGWDNTSDLHNPGFPTDGRWNVRWEGIIGLP